MAAFGVLVVVRLITFATAMLLFGSSLFALYRPAQARCSGEPPRARAGLPPAVAVGASVLLLVSAAGWLTITAIGINDPDNPLPLAGVLRTVLLDTDFGRVWMLQLALAALLIGGLIAGASARFILVPAGAVLASEAWIGHAAIGAGAQGALRLGAMAVHLLAAGAWLGGLVPLGLLLLEARRAGRGPLLVAACTALRRFSGMGYVAVSLILLTGVTSAYFLVGSVAALTTTPYGRVLSVKLALVALLLGVALANRFYLLPRLAVEGRTDPAALSALGRNVLLEQLLGLLVLGAVSVLGLLPPAVP